VSRNGRLRGHWIEALLFSPFAPAVLRRPDLKAIRAELVEAPAHHSPLACARSNCTIENHSRYRYDSLFKVFIKERTA
jgi:hypothetical protein